MNGLKKSGWKYWDHFQTIHPQASAKGKNTFSAARTAPVEVVEDDPPSDSDAAATPGLRTASASLPHNGDNAMDVDSALVSTNSKCCHSNSSAGLSDSGHKSGGKSVPPSSTVVSDAASAFPPKKATKSIAGSTARSSSHSCPSKPSSAVGGSFISSKSDTTTASQKVTKMTQATALAELKNLMAGLVDGLPITPEDPATKARREMTSFVNKDDYLLPTQKMHCILLFIKDIAYAECLQAFVGDLGDSNDEDRTVNLEGILAYYDTLLDIDV